MVGKAPTALFGGNACQAGVAGIARYDRCRCPASRRYRPRGCQAALKRWSPVASIPRNAARPTSRFSATRQSTACTSDQRPARCNDEILLPPVVEHHAAITDRQNGDRDSDAAKRFGGLLRACWNHDGHPTVRNALKLIALIAVRPGELRRLRWTWVALDGDAPCIKFPASVMKMREDFEVPLSQQAVDVLAKQREMTGS
jgi:integrase